MLPASVIELLHRFGRTIGQDEEEFLRAKQATLRKTESLVHTDEAMSFVSRVIEAIEAVQHSRQEVALDIFYSLVNELLERGNKTDMVPVLQSWMGKVVANQGRIQKAAEYFDIALSAEIASKPIRVHIAMLKSLSQRRLGQREDALKTMLSGLDAVEEIDDDQMAIGIHLAIANTYSELLNISKSLEHYDICCEMVNSSNVRKMDMVFAFVNRARALMTAGRIDEAKSDMRKVVGCLVNTQYVPPKIMYWSSSLLIHGLASSFAYCRIGLDECDKLIDSRKDLGDAWRILIGDYIEVYSLYNRGEAQRDLLFALVSKQRNEAQSGVGVFLLVHFGINALLNRDIDRLRDTLALADGATEMISDLSSLTYLKFIRKATSLLETSTTATIADFEYFLNVFRDAGFKQEEFRLLLVVATLVEKTEQLNNRVERAIDYCVEYSMTEVAYAFDSWSPYGEYVRNKAPDLFLASKEQERQIVVDGVEHILRVSVYD